MTKRVTPLFAVVALGLGGSIASASPDAQTPRTLPSGAPACGNAQTKGPRRPCIETATASQTAAVPDRPRTLVTGAPACGNVLAKVGDAKDPLYVSCLRNEGEGVIVRQKMVIAKVLSLFGLAPSASQVRDVEPVKPRCTRNGSPACGNVARRAVPREGL